VKNKFGQTPKSKVQPGKKGFGVILGIMFYVFGRFSSKFFKQIHIFPMKLTRNIQWKIRKEKASCFLLYPIIFHKIS
jgi:hypothetical protein